MLWGIVRQREKAEDNSQKKNTLSQARPRSSPSTTRATPLLFERPRWELRDQPRHATRFRAR